MADSVLTEVTDQVMIITLNRPEKYNAVNRDLLDGLADACLRAGQPDVRAVVLTGSGRGFCAGADLTETQEPIDPPSRRIRSRFAPVFMQLAALRRPVIAAVNGAVAGAGLSIAGAETARYHALRKSRSKLVYFLAINQPHIRETQRLLPLHERRQLIRLGIVLGQQQLTRLPVMQIGSKLMLQRFPAFDGLDRQSRLGRVASLPPHTARAGPGCRRFAGDPRPLDHQRLTPLPRQGIGNGIPDHAAADDGNLRLYCGHASTP